ncbi:MAG: hypothetical protein WA160_06455 [Pseudobdellovibrio sp.]
MRNFISIFISSFFALSAFAYEFKCIKGSNSYEIRHGIIYCGCDYESWARRGSQVCVGGLYNSWQRDDSGQVYCGGNYDSWQRGDDGKVCVGGLYSSWQRSDDGSIVCGGAYDSYQLSENGLKICGGIYKMLHPKECDFQDNDIVIINSVNQFKF